MIDPLDYQGLVRFVALRYTGHGLCLDDLIAEGQFGLLTACRKFDPALGFSFTTYAVPWISKTIGKALSAQVPLIRVPSNVHQLIQSRAEPRTRRQEEAIRHGKAARGRHINERTLESSSSKATLDSITVDHRENEGERRVAAHDVAILMRCLTERQADVIRLRYGLDGQGERTLDEIGIACGSSYQAAQQSERKAMEKLRTRAHVESRRAAG